MIMIQANKNYQIDIYKMNEPIYLGLNSVKRRKLGNKGLAIN